jgi:hypothetical protein
MTLSILYAVGFAHGLILAVIITRRPKRGGYQPNFAGVRAAMPNVSPPRPPVGGTGVAPLFQEWTARLCFVCDGAGRIYGTADSCACPFCNGSGRRKV